MANTEEDIDLPYFFGVPAIGETEARVVPVEELRDKDSYEKLKGRILRDFELARLLKLGREGGLNDSEIGSVIDTLKTQLLGVHPVLPLLTGDVEVNDRKMQIPLVCKLYAPKVKMLNAIYGESLTDELIAQIHRLVESHFGGEDGNLPIISFCNKDFKTGKGILNLNSPSLDAADPWGNFVRRTELFQRALTILIDVFDQTHGCRLMTALGGQFSARMVFGATDWPVGGEPLSTKDYVTQFLLAEQVCNMAQRRLQSFEVRRRDTIRLDPLDFIKHLEKDFRLSESDIKKLYVRHKDEAAWEDVFVLLDDDFVFLSPHFIQCFRKDVLDVHYPHLDTETLEVLTRFLDVVNTIDVLKPFLGAEFSQFARRLETIAELLNRTPKNMAEKGELLKALAGQARVSLKDRTETLENPVAQTRLAFSERLWLVLCQNADEDLTLLIGDVKAFGPVNVIGLAYDLLAHTTDSATADYDALAGLAKLIFEAGDAFSFFLRSNEAFLSTIYGSAERVTLDASGGDEVMAIVPTRGIERVHQRYLSNGDLRMVAAALPNGPALTEVQAADLVACIALVSEDVFDVLKCEEPRDENISRDPVELELVSRGKVVNLHGDVSRLVAGSAREVDPVLGDYDIPVLAEKVSAVGSAAIGALAPVRLKA